MLSSKNSAALFTPLYIGFAASVMGGIVCVWQADMLTLYHLQILNLVPLLLFAWIIGKFHFSPLRSLLRHITDVNVAYNWIALEKHLRDLQVQAQQTKIELQSSAHYIESAHHLKTQFLSTISHELRTPMNGILGMAGLLLDTPLNAEQRRMAEAAQESAESLLNMINDILDYVKLEERRMGVDNEECCLATLTQQMKEFLTPRAAERNTKIIVTLSKDIPDKVLLDFDKFQQVLFYLVSNSIKFTSNGQIYIVLEKASEDPGNRHLKCSIKDTGIGFDENFLSHAFEEFSVVHKDMARRYGGLGLSLSICKNLVKLMGGTITARNRIEKGSEVAFTFQFKEVPFQAEILPHPSNLSKAASSDKPHSRLRILVAEDNRVNQALIKAYLAKQSHHVEFANNGKEAIQILQSFPFDLILMDIQMPEMDGIEATKLIRSMDNPVKHIPIIAVTANSLNMDAQDYLDIGMQGLVTKPLDLNLLMSTIDHVMNDHVGWRLKNQDKILENNDKIRQIVAYK